MIKYFQKLKAKKGFTLVELIVVIAIIGVLAAILIPTMLNYVTSSRVTSADTTASEIKKTIDNFLTEADTLGYGMLLSSSAKCSVKGECDSSGKWTLTIGAGAGLTSDGTTGIAAFKTKKGIGEWKASASIEHGKTRVDAKDDATAQLAWKLMDAFPDVKGVSFGAYLEGGKTMYVAYTADSDKADFSVELKDFKAGSSEWNKATAGVDSKGYIVGTAPKLPISTGTKTS
ncbi:MAG: DUF5021 domain-containing protein [Ruminiclostridium sp.]|nr:DUF5021 domain-containing protein [Ruminiclostridium sp.]